MKKVHDFAARSHNYMSPQGHHLIITLGTYLRGNEQAKAVKTHVLHMVHIQVDPRRWVQRLHVSPRKRVFRLEICIIQ